LQDTLAWFLAPGQNLAPGGHSLRQQVPRRGAALAEPWPLVPHAGAAGRQLHACCGSTTLFPLLYKVRRYVGPVSDEGLKTAEYLK